MSLLALLPFLSLASATSPAEPPGNQILLGFWANPFEAGTSPSPVDVNKAIGHNASIFQMSQYIPLAPVDNSTGIGGPIRSDLIDATNTNAAVYLTVYPFQGFEAVQQSDLDALANQVAALKTPVNRTVFLRYAPEFQGIGWNKYGNQPTDFLEQWKNMANTVRAKAPDVQLVWSPNTAQGYPWGMSFPSGANAAADRQLLDTNGDGSLDSGDDAYKPYWPGAEFVDWAGMSIYYDISNSPEAGGFCANILDGFDPLRGSSITNFYSRYCEGPDSAGACMISECATGWHTGDGSGSGVGEVALKKAWIQDCVTNTSFLDSHPRIKAITQFEFAKNENYESGISDHRWTNNSEVLTMAKGLLDGFGDRIAWATAPTPSTSSGASTAGGGNGTSGGSSGGSSSNNGGSGHSGVAGQARALSVVGIASVLAAVAGGAMLL